MPTKSSMVVLVIDDDVSMSGTMQRKFEKLGFRAEVVLDGGEGLSLMRQRRFDGILLDLQMPIQDGFDVLRERAATLNAETPVFVLSAMEQDKRQLAEELGARKAFDKLSIPSPLAVAEEIRDELVAK